jgi:hypothetical protein
MAVQEGPNGPATPQPERRYQQLPRP